MRGGEGLECRELTPGDRPAFAVFRCAGGTKEAWADRIEEMIRNDLADALARGDVEGLGLWDGNDLLAVVTWWVGQDGLWNISVLAVRLGKRRHRYGLQLKTALLTRAWEAGASAVISEVHEDNQAMYDLNRKLGAVMRLGRGDALGRDRHFTCIIRRPT